jgi:hypothetical protein
MVAIQRLLRNLSKDVYFPPSVRQPKFYQSQVHMYKLEKGYTDFYRQNCDRGAKF